MQTNFVSARASHLLRLFEKRAAFVNCDFSVCVFTVSLPAGAEAGAEGNPRTARPSLPLHELPEARRGRPRAPVLPRGRYVCPELYRCLQKTLQLLFTCMKSVF